MTLEQLQEIMKASLDSYGEGYFGEDDIPEGMELVCDEDWTQSGKYQYSFTVYKDAEGNHFGVNNSRSGSYHTDWYYGTPQLGQYKPVEKVVTTIEWVPV